MKKGFTLVELSIVLVIIGLLISGILVGRNLAESAKLTKFVSTLAGYDAAVNGFQSKFNGLPADVQAFGGNGDGYIARTETWQSCEGPSQATANALTGEIANFWAGLYPDKYLASDINSYI